MTEAIKQWMEKEADDFSTSAEIQEDFEAGLTKGIEISVGFSKWAAWNYLLNDGPDDVWFDKKDGSPFTTSQLLEKYLKTLEP